MAVEPSGLVYVAGFRSDNVFLVQPGGPIVEIADRTGDGFAQLNGAVALAVEPSGQVYVAGYYSDNVFEISPGPALSETSALVLPGFEADAEDPDGPTTLFAVRNTTGEPLQGTISYLGTVTTQPLRTDGFNLGAGATLTRNVRDHLGGLEIEDGVARGMLLVKAQGGAASRLRGDYFRVDSGNGFAAGGRLLDAGELCSQQQVRFVDFGGGSELRVLVDRPRGDDLPSFSYTAYDEAGAVVGEGVHFTSRYLTVLDAAELTGGARFGTVRFDFSNSGGGWASAEHSAFGRFSVEVDAACGERDVGPVMEILDQYFDGTATPFGAHEVAKDAAGNLYVSSGVEVLRITPGGTITRILAEYGDPEDPDDDLCWLFDLAVEPSGTVYVTGMCSDNVLRVTPDGTITQILDRTGDGTHELIGPAGVAVDGSGTVYVAGHVSSNVFAVAADGTITVILDETGDGIHELVAPVGVAVDGSGTVYVAGHVDHVFAVAADGTVTEILGDAGGPDGALTTPEVVVVDDTGNVYVAGLSSDNVFRIAPGGTVTEILDATGDGASPLELPAPIAVDEDGTVYVAGHRSHNVFAVAADGTVTEVADAAGDGSYSLRFPGGLFVDEAGALFVAASGNVLRYRPPGALEGLIVPGFEVAAGDADGPTALFAVRNTSAEPVDGVVDYLGLGAPEPLRSDAFHLDPGETLTRNVGSDLSQLEVEDGVARGIVRVTELGDRAARRLAGDYFRVDAGNDFASGGRLVRAADFCAFQEVRFVDFGGGSELRVLVDRPRGEEAPSFSYTAYDESGAVLAEGEYFTSDALTVLDAGELAAGASFGTVHFDFVRSGGGWVSARHSAFGRFSVEIDGACVDR